MTEAISVNVKNNLQNDVGSLNTRIPTRTVPTAPIPVHTGYAVPRGIVLVALVRRTMLRRQRIVNAVYQNAALLPIA